MLFSVVKGMFLRGKTSKVQNKNKIKKNQQALGCLKSPVMQNPLPLKLVTIWTYYY